MSSQSKSELLRAFASRVRSNIELELEREAETSRELRKTVVPRVHHAVESARASGMCQAAWLFGSFAWGEPRPDSDLDIMVQDCRDPDALAALIMRRTDRMVHVVVAESAPESLRARVLEEGMSL